MSLALSYTFFFIEFFIYIHIIVKNSIRLRENKLKLESELKDELVSEQYNEIFG